MTDPAVIYHGGQVFDGQNLCTGQMARIDGNGAELAPEFGDDPAPRVDLAGDILCPGFVDLQVNGGGGVMLNDDPSAATMARIAAAHRAQGTTVLLPTLITDRPEATERAIDAAIAATLASMPGIGGLHLEGPHLSLARKGAHDARYIRPMQPGDLRLLQNAAQKLPCLLVTIAPESVTAAQTAALSEAGALVSLGHTDADFATCQSYAKAGARMATHLFNAMSPLGNREPGLVGAALRSGALSAGLIADGIHVHPATIAAAWAAKTGPGEIFLVSDAMAVAGTELDGFTLNDRWIARHDGRLVLPDGTLAGADLDLARAVRIMVEHVGIAPETALRAATTVPAGLIGLEPGQCGWIRLRRDFSAAEPL